MVQNVIENMIDYFGDDVKRINHAIKVYGFASSIGKLEGIEEEKLLILEIAAVLHDIGIKVSEEKYGCSNGKYQELEGPPVAEEILTKLGVSQNIIERVCFLIANHHTYNKIDDIDFQILVEADFLVNIFEDKLHEKASLIKEKYFKTKIGTAYIERMYL
ncbi:HD domain-containing protein [Clostridium sp. MSJ-11]|uniref:HD domain-containing protein n=1 Tax=Clostridium mobile TaxID=2841512 RepID=A0ABS6EMK7_9CLOT|nr:HD domain-containing protein [Clostridium mobile]MBU5485619.1 HD domain-containing protein [Clostridium mobile]